ncbi:MAG: S-methyl-5'-thioadenosine phosphorylase [Acidimicrobiaceae bacterium]|nr:S-methyl-5'-thioadenosine phosphorylase [Acidimicrobiaceae bacterium]
MLGLITGSGFDGLSELDEAEPDVISTPYGDVPVTRGWLDGSQVVVLRRHGAGHHVPPHRINYRANVRAIDEAGATAVVATAVSGAIDPALGLGDLVLVDQFIDVTHGRIGTFHDDAVIHTDMTEPYDPALRALLKQVGEAVGIPLVDGGTYVCTNGPRFETPAEIRMYRAAGATLVGMTGCPEVALAVEASLPYASIGVVSNPAAGQNDEPLGLDDIRAAMAAAARPVRTLLAGAAARLT